MLFKLGLSVTVIFCQVHVQAQCFPEKKILNVLRPRQNGRHFADDTFKRMFLNEDVRISIRNSLKFVPKGPTNNIPTNDD